MLGELYADLRGVPPLNVHSLTPIPPDIERARALSLVRAIVDVSREIDDRASQERRVGTIVPFPSPIVVFRFAGPIGSTGSIALDDRYCGYSTTIRGFDSSSLAFSISILRK